ncbi:hypothetical protein [Loktanella sp. S4079]|uniref:hypothetical protein n=1 Tax=Loktanella sp. S4079 TaxID=579483 RepID=UPI0005FA2A88|nr:hypothetical protein [Loktanella sp. S4079]KJZ20862.1 hypothetical protein TW80_09030 [Loktanella sp. S4079]
MASVTENKPSNPWQVWRPGIDPAADALERVSVLINRHEHITAGYAFTLGESARRYAEQCSLGFLLGLEMVVREHGNQAAILGWRHAASTVPQPSKSQNEGEKDA